MNQTESADAVIRDHVAWSIGAGLIPIPIGDVFAVTALQLDLVGKLAEIYEQRFTPNLGKSLITSLTGQVIARIGASAVKAIPVVGTLVGMPAQAVLAGASTYAVGHLFKGHFAAGGALDAFNPEKLREAYAKYTEKGRGFIAEMRAEAGEPASVQSIAETLTTLARLRDGGDLTEQEYERLKVKLLERGE